MLTLRRLIVEQNPARRAVHVVELAGTQRPKKRRECAYPKGQAKQDQPENRCHFRTRHELPNTSNDDDDIAAAASQGVTNPAIASGTISTL